MTEEQSDPEAAPEPQVLRIALLSDLHAYDRCGPDEKSKPSHLCTLDPQDIPTHHPIRGLLHLIESQSLSTDLLLCPGDLGDKARPDCIAFSWKIVHDIGSALKVRRVVGTAGNHDVDSRFKFSDHDPKGFLQSLSPPFPLSEEALNDKFWSRNYAVVENDIYRLVVLNSCAFHGGAPAEIDHGRVSDRTLSGLTDLLKRVEPKPVNILLCHHHPHKDSDVKLGEYDEMLGGQQLLELLGSGRSGDWLVIHGHKHHPKLCYAAGNASAPVIFSAGSLCASLYAELGTIARNQFYIISLPYHRFRDFGFVGTFEAWDWLVGYDIDRPFDCFASLESLVFGALRDSRPVLIPFGPKIFTLCCLLVASVHFPKVAVWRVTSGANEPAVDRVADGTVVGMRVEFAPEATADATMHNHGVFRIPDEAHNKDGEEKIVAMEI